MDKKLNIFIWNDSAVANAIISKLSKSERVNNLYYQGIGCIVLEDKPVRLKSDGIRMLKEMKEKNIEYVFSNSEANSLGFIEFARKYGFKTIGAPIPARKFEGSKIKMKAMFKKYNIKTPDYNVVENQSYLRDALKTIGLPCFIKADGFAYSISAVNVNSEKKFYKISKKYLNGYYMDDSRKIIIEKAIKGTEFSILCALDSKTIKILLPVKDYKRKYNNYKSVNTGGMGTTAPAKLSDKQLSLLNKLCDEIKYMLDSEKLFYKGFITLNVIFTKDEVFLLEINTRMGDSEGQAVLALLETDLAELFFAIENEKLSELKLEWKAAFSSVINVVNSVYPNIHQYLVSSIPVTSIELLRKKDIDIFFYKKVKKDKFNYYQDTNRFISLVCCHSSIKSASEKIYQALSTLKGENLFYRKDIWK